MVVDGRLIGYLVTSMDYPRGLKEVVSHVTNSSPLSSVLSNSLLVQYEVSLTFIVLTSMLIYIRNYCKYVFN